MKLKLWLKYVKPYIAYFIFGPICMIIEVIGEMMMPSRLAAVINNAAEQGWGFAVRQSGLMVLISLMMMAGGIGGAWFGAKASVNFAADVRLDVYRRVQNFSFANIDKFSTGSLVTRLTNDVTQVQNMVNMMLRMALRAPGMMIGALIMAISISRRLSVVLAITLPLLLVSILFLIITAFSIFAKMQEKLDHLNATVQENITNVRVVKSFVRADYETDKFHGANRSLKQTAMTAMKRMILMSPIMTLFMNAATIAVLMLGSQLVFNRLMPVGDLSAFLTYCTQVLSSMMMVTMMFMMLSRALASAKRIREVLEEVPDISDENCACPEKRVSEGSVEFKNVSFRYYKNSAEKVLDHISLKIEPGQTVGIIGSTGCGKTTLVSMIPRLYDTDEGDVLIDGVSVRDYSLKNLRDGVGMVLQKNVLFSGSIEDNLRWGNEDAAEQELTAAAADACADGFIREFSGGYGYDLGQGGKNVSGGQKQRLCIARALLKKPRILILDDSTSAVDTATEARIRQAFEKGEQITRLIIAQRISSVQDADLIAVMNDGKIVGLGTHGELLENCPDYQEIYYSQNEKPSAAGKEA